ncbi:SH3 and FCH domain-containing protein [Quillaja saponaria]|uniref:SH3 and FCH domain-containing protein n=1 Tax=Quillaja saponaria TaxID=32244 RepID=A0AAD7QC91_QUISA|nr:SH3 and FCH domain-containing protein [Quillaja saponaria]
MATPFESSNQETAVRRQKRGPPYKFLLPLVYAPVLPLIRLSLRHKPVLRDRLFAAVLVGAFVHGSYLVSDLYDAESK